MATRLARDEGHGLVCLPAVAIDEVAEAQLLAVIRRVSGDVLHSGHGGPWGTVPRGRNRDDAGLRGEESSGTFL